MRKFLAKVLEIVMFIGFSVLLSLFVMEWMAGCGETYTDSKGVVHQNECLFINK